MDREYKFVVTIMLLAAVITAVARLPHIINSQQIVVDYENTQEVVVERGDTLWDIAESLKLPRDTRLVVEEIKILNGLKDYTIYPGQALKVPKPKVEVANSYQEE